MGPSGCPVLHASPIMHLCTSHCHACHHTPCPRRHEVHSLLQQVQLDNSKRAKCPKGPCGLDQTCTRGHAPCMQGMHYLFFGVTAARLRLPNPAAAQPDASARLPDCICISDLSAAGLDLEVNRAPTAGLPIQRPVILLQCGTGRTCVGSNCADPQAI
jgi:hypothetical protein